MAVVAGKASITIHIYIHIYTQYNLSLNRLKGTPDRDVGEGLRRGKQVSENHQVDIIENGIHGGFG